MEFFSIHEPASFSLLEYFTEVFFIEMFHNHLDFCSRKYVTNGLSDILFLHGTQIQDTLYFSSDIAQIYYFWESGA